MSTGRFPTTASGFVQVVERSPGADAWRVAVIDAEPDDSASTRTVFWLADGTPRNAFVAFEHGRLIVNLADGSSLGYHFDLDALYQHGSGWSWAKHLGQKSWVRPEHLALIHGLCSLFPHQTKGQRR